MFLENAEKCLSATPNLLYDEACLNVNNLINGSVEVFGQYAECHNCNYQSLANLSISSNTSILINTKYVMQMYFVNTASGSRLCDWSQRLLEHYRYGWNLTKNCSNLYIIDSADNAYIPILSAFIMLFFFGTLWYMIKCIYKCTRGNQIWRHFMWNSVDLETDLGTTSETPLVVERAPAIKKHPNRIKSVDVFRGFCIMVMVFVNYGGGKYWFFEHSVWNGLTIADLVFPWFAWVMGLSMAISFTSRLRRACPRRQLFLQVIKRSSVLILLGIMQNSFHDGHIDSLRFPGVLQRLGITYLIVGIIEVIFMKRTQAEFQTSYLIPEVTSAWPQWIIMLSLLVIHTCITFFVDVPGCGRGYFGPGGLDNSGNCTNCTGGVAGFIDRAVLGSHMYTDHSLITMYEVKQKYDPEGILGILTCAFIVFLGVHAGRILHTYTNVQVKTIRWVICGVICSTLGGVLCSFTRNDGLIPINKKLWSLSFVLTLGGMAFVLQAFLFVVVDVTHKWGGRPFFYPGMNSIAIYILHSLFKTTLPVGWISSSNTHAAFLAQNLWGTAIWVCFAIYLYKHNVFLSI